jgi:hypothetical protein
VYPRYGKCLKIDCFNRPGRDRRAQESGTHPGESLGTVGGHEMQAAAAGPFGAQGMFRGNAAVARAVVAAESTTCRVTPS